jgi:hypothetical protein
MKTCRIEGIGKKVSFDDCYKAVKIFNTDTMAFKIKEPRKKRVVKNNMSEKRLEKEIIFSLKNAGYQVYKTGGAGAHDYNTQFNVNGMADLIVMGKSGVYFLEVKVEKKRNWKDGGLTGKQPQFRDFCLNNGLSYAIVYSKEEALKKVVI